MHILHVRWVLVAYAALGVLLWPVPLLNRLHAESTAVLAFVAFFAAGLSSLKAFDHEASLGRVLMRQEAALLVPWVLLTAAVLWAPNCAYLTGLLFFFLFPVVSVVLAVAGAYAVSGTGLRRKKMFFVGMGVAVAVLGPIYDLGFHPQFYTYNPIFGGVLGPIYDEQLTLRPGLFVSRALALLWGVLFSLIGKWLRGRGDACVAPATGWRRWVYGLPGLVAVGVAIVLCYVFAARLGLNTPAWYLQEQLGGQLRTEHFDIYYAPEALTEEELARLAETAEYRYARLEAKLKVEGPARIALYLYPDADVKARLTGARYTNVAPVWLPRPQIHLLQEYFAGSFGHELVHVFSRAFGLSVLNASVAVGLVEGLAVALEPPSGRPTPHEQVSAALLQGGVSSTARPLAENLAARLSPLGFWTGRGAVSYTATGSFVQYLITRYGIEKLKAVYAWANFEEVYGKPLAVLAEEWEAFLLDLPLVARAAGPLSSRRFAVPSLFEVRCPHYVPPPVRAYRAGLEALEKGDTMRALAELSEALMRRPQYTAARVVRARLRLARGVAPEVVVSMLRAVPAARRPPGLLVTLGDAYALLGRPAAARARYEAAADRLPLYRQESLALLVLRKAVAGRPAVVRALVRGGEPAAEARRLAAFEGAAVRLLRAERLIAAGRGEPALRLLRSTRTVGGVNTAFAQNVLARQRLAWLARAAYLTGALADAARYARQAARAFRVLGARNEAAFFADLAAKFAWLRRVEYGGVGVWGMGGSRIEWPPTPPYSHTPALSNSTMISL